MGTGTQSKGKRLARKQHRTQGDVQRARPENKIVQRSSAETLRRYKGGISEQNTGTETSSDAARTHAETHYTDPTASTQTDHLQTRRERPQKKNEGRRDRR